MVVILPFALLIIHVLLAATIRRRNTSTTRVEWVGWLALLSLMSSCMWSAASLPLGYIYAFCCIDGQPDPPDVEAERMLFSRTLALPFKACSQFPPLREWLGDACYNLSWLMLPLALFLLGLLVFLVVRPRSQQQPSTK